MCVCVCVCVCVSSRSSLCEREKNRKPPTEITIKEGEGPEDRPTFGTRERRRESERGESRRKTYDEGLKGALQKGAVAAAAPPGATLGAPAHRQLVHHMLDCTTSTGRGSEDAAPTSRTPRRCSAARHLARGPRRQGGRRSRSRSAEVCYTRTLLASGESRPGSLRSRPRGRAWAGPHQQSFHQMRRDQMGVRLVRSR